MEKLIHKFIELKFSLKFINIQRVKKCVKVAHQECPEQLCPEYEKSEEMSASYKEIELIESTQHLGLNDSMLSQINFEIHKEKEHTTEHDREHGLISECGEMLVLDQQTDKFDFWFFM